MGLIASLPEIDKHPSSVFVMHEQSEKLIPEHSHKKGQLSYVEGGIAYITAGHKTFVVPARHFFWIPRALKHTLRIGHSGTMLHSLYYYSHDDHSHAFYNELGIYPAPELLIQMLKYTQRWDGKHIGKKDDNFEFLVSMKKLLPGMRTTSALIILPITDDDRMQKITRYLEKNLDEALTLKAVSTRFNMSERSMSRLFQAVLNISFLQYLKTLRMVKAIEMIVRTNKSISEISLSTGYNSIGSFSNAFYQFTRSRPSDFRKH